MGRSGSTARAAGSGSQSPSGLSTTLPLEEVAGLYDSWRDPSGDEMTMCTIITTQPNALGAPIHNCLPVILLPEDVERWIDPDMTEPEMIVSLLRPYPADLLQTSPM